MLLRSVFAKTYTCWRRLANWISSRYLCTRCMLQSLKWPGKLAQCISSKSSGGSNGGWVVVMRIWQLAKWIDSKFTLEPFVCFMMKNWGNRFPFNYYLLEATPIFAQSFRRIICLAIDGGQSESLRRLLVFHELLVYGHDNSVGVFRNSSLPYDINGRDGRYEHRCFGNERKAARKRSITEMVSNIKHKCSNLFQ
jgi:hypothetical protein